MSEWADCLGRLKLSVARGTVGKAGRSAETLPTQGVTGAPLMRVTFATLPRSVSVVVVDEDTLVVTERLRAAIEPRLPYATAAVLLALGIADAVANAARLAS